MISRSRFSQAVALRNTSVKRVRRSASLKTSSRLVRGQRSNMRAFKAVRFAGFTCTGKGDTEIQPSSFFRTRTCSLLSMRPFVACHHSSRKPEIAHQHCNAKAIVIPAMLPQRQISFRQRVQPNQLSLIHREGEQFKALWRSQQLAAGHSTPTIPDRLYFFAEPKVVGIAMRLPDQSKNRDHIVRDGVIYVPKINRIPALVLFGVMPRKEEVGHPARLPGISFRNLE